MAEGLLLGLDVGTTFSKAAAVSADGVERGHGGVRTPWRGVPTGAEIDPRAMAAAAAEAARAALARAGGGPVLAVGVTSMAETGILLGPDGEPVVPSIVWYDTRGEGEAGEIAEVFGNDGFTIRTGLPVSRLCSLAKYRWMREHWPEAARGTRWLGVAEWIVRALGGEEAAELSLASRSGFLDVGDGAWWDDALAWCEAPAGLLPEPVHAGSPCGRIGSLLPEARDAVLTVAGHDHSCASVGGGAVRPGDLFDSCGTAEAFVRAVEPGVPESDVLLAVTGGVTVGRHVVAGDWVLMGGFRSGLALQRILDVLGVGEEGRSELDAAALALPRRADGVSVEGIVEDRATISGLPLGATAAHVWRAALEALAAHGLRIRSTIEAVAGETRRLIVTGGGVRSSAVRAVKRSMLGPFEEPAVGEAGSRGSALFAGIAAGVFRGVEDLPPVQWKEPDP